MLLERISAGRTDLVHDWTAGGGAVDAAVAGAGLIHWCAYYGDVSAIRHLISEGAELAWLGPDLGLNGAAFHGHWRLCEYLVEQGADARRADPETGETALHSAFCKAESLAHERVAQVLLAAGADPDAATRPGVETGAFMRDVRTRGETALHRAAAYGTLASIHMLIDAGARLDVLDAAGDSPLSWGSRALRPAPILRLLCYGDFRIHPDHAGMEANLLGAPFKGEG